MNRKKVTPLSLYMKDLKNDSGKFIDPKIASEKFKKLSIQDKDYYEVRAKRSNSKIPSEPVFTKQKDTLGNNLKEISEISIRKAEWEKKARNLIMDIANSENVLHKHFYTVKISGVDFCRSEDNERVFATSEICLIKFSFMKGIIDKLILFPDIINVAAGYRQHLYEDLEENVGWKPETFRNNHSINETIIAIRNFFNEKYEPIYVPTKDHQEEVGLALQTLYDDVQMSCPWIKSFEDWGKNCQIYQLEYLITSVLNKYCDDTNSDDISVSVVLDFWRKLKVEIAPETCERHMQYGLANQCCTNMLLKYLYGSFLMLTFDGKPQTQTLVSEAFFRDMDFIIPIDNIDENPGSAQSKKANSNWNNYFDQSNIEDIISNFSGITIKNDAEPTSNYIRQGDWGRGRGLVRRQENSSNEIPGSSATTKIKLPKVVC